MIRKILSGGIVAIGLASPAWAQDQCAAPKAPTIPDGARAAPNQIAAAQNDIKTFAAASDTYQACLAAELGRQKDLAKQNNVELDSNLQTALETKTQDHRKEVARVAAAWGAAVDAFTKAQQRKQRQASPGTPPAMGGAYGGGRY